MSSIPFFQLLCAPLPFSRCQVILLRTVKSSESTLPITRLDSQSQQTYTEAFFFISGATRVSQLRVYSSYSSRLFFENTFPLNDFRMLYGGSIMARSKLSLGRRWRMSKQSPSRVRSLMERSGRASSSAHTRRHLSRYSRLVSSEVFIVLFLGALLFAEVSFFVSLSDFFGVGIVVCSLLIRGTV